MTKRQGGVDCLFSNENGRRLNNIKFFRGTKQVITPAELRAEMCASIERRKQPGAKISANPPSCDKEPVDVRTLVADM